MSIGSRIKERRESLGITQVQLAELLGVTKGAIGNYETDANSPKASILYKVFDVLHCDANYIFQDEMNVLETVNSLPISGRALKVATAFDKADDRSQAVVELTLEPYMDMPTAKDSGARLA